MFFFEKEMRGKKEKPDSKRNLLGEFARWGGEGEDDLGGRITDCECKNGGIEEEDAVFDFVVINVSGLFFSFVVEAVFGLESGFGL